MKPLAPNAPIPPCRRPVKAIPRLRRRLSALPALAGMALGTTGTHANPDETAMPTEPRQARSAVVHLVASEQAGAIERIDMLSDTGEWLPAAWAEGDLAGRVAEVSFPIAPTHWEQCRLRLVTARPGDVELRLTGPWMPRGQAEGDLFQAEVMWQSVAGVPDGDFESLQQRGLGASGWSLWGDVEGLLRQGPEGRPVAVTWARRVLSRKVATDQRGAVELAFAARPLIHPDLDRLTALAGRADTPASEAMDRLRRGINLGNDLEFEPGAEWRMRHGPETLAAIAAAGFDHVRLPVAWHFHLTDDDPPVVSAEGLAAVDALVASALEQGLKVMLNWHHFDDLLDDPEGQRDTFLRVWCQLAAHYREAPADLLLEFYNEPREALTTEWMNALYADVIAAVRAIDPDRLLVVGPGDWNHIAELPALDLPPDDDRLVVSVHLYEPFLFTHQGASWVPVLDTTPIHYPGPPASPVAPGPRTAADPHWLHRLEAYNRMPADVNPGGPRSFTSWLAFARRWSEATGRPVHLGEFGCIDDAPAADRVRYVGEVRRAAEAAGIGWALWDWNARFNYWDQEQGAPVPGMQEALFGEP